MTPPRLIENISAEVCGKIEIVMTDIDDTLTAENRLLPEAFCALWQLKRAGYKVVPITGRPAGWCDMIIRQWPVDAVVGENGAFAFILNRDEKVEHIYHPSVADNPQERLKPVGDDVLKKVPGTRIAKDQFSRMFDLAIDFREEPPYLGIPEAEKIKSICEAHGAQAKISSIHVNTWFGDYDKTGMSMSLLKDLWSLSDDEIREKVIFFGDSPNDEPMFRQFNHSCGVSNIAPFLKMMTYTPSFVTRSPNGRGFKEGVDVILKNSAP
ncbi:MAG: HAD-IIB family hydrolase [Spirochaetia bacterium]